MRDFLLKRVLAQREQLGEQSNKQGSRQASKQGSRQALGAFSRSHALEGLIFLYLFSNSNVTILVKFEGQHYKRRRRGRVAEDSVDETNLYYSNKA